MSEVQTAFQDAPRELGITAGLERRALQALAARVPGWVQPDHLTALGLLANLGAGAAFAFSAQQPTWLWLVNLCLVVNWYGDSLDGTLARHRRQPRPRYGFYLDHLVDALSAAALAVGLGLSGLARPWTVAMLLLAYYLVCIEIYLATYTVGVFRVAFGGIGGTELRLLLCAANLLALSWPAFQWQGVRVGLYDVLGWGATAGLAVAFGVSAVRHTRVLARREPPGVTSPAGL